MRGWRRLYICLVQNMTLDNRYRSLIKVLPAGKIVFDRESLWSFDQLHKSQIMHVVTEAGYSADRSKSFIDFHKRTVKSVMAFMGMTRYPQRQKTQHKKIYNKIISFKSQHDGLWHPGQSIYGPIKKGQLLGAVYSPDGKKLQEVISQTSGEYLWLKTSMPCRRGEILIEICSKGSFLNNVSVI